jgi:Zn-dependent M28 family amino/carboxypeptidase
MRRGLSLLLLVATACAAPRAGGGRSSTPTAPTVVPPPAAVPEDPIGPEALMRDVRFLASTELRGRGTGTADEARAAEWLATQLQAVGLQAVAGKYVHGFTAGPWTSRNVLGVLPGSAVSDGRVVVLGAHFDHDGVRKGVLFPGADDNASGVAVVLGITRVLAARKESPRRSVVVALFGAEEVGMVGSRALVRQNLVPAPSIAAMVNLDMLGRPLQDQPTFRFAQRLVGIDAVRSIGVDGLRGRPWLEEIVRSACAAEDHRAITIDDLPEIARGAAERISRGRSDHVAFEEAGVPSVIFSSGESVDYHQPSDTADTLHPELLARRARIVLRTVEALTTATLPP